MRLLNTSAYTLHDDEEKVVLKNPEYAILSHVWERDTPEIIFPTLNPADLRNPNLHTPSLDKIRGACAKAREQRLQWIWIDTCCIDKSPHSTELTKSLNRMLEWYRDAKVCYAYIRDVVKTTPGPGMFQSRDPERNGLKAEWFERGWTLQELLAPRYMEFYDQRWAFIGTKNDLADHLHPVTGIAKKYLTGVGNFREASVATRMSWMAGRKTTEIEDIAYSMIGILGVSMRPDYGEGAKAFLSLQKALIQGSPDESIFAWTIPTRGLRCYRNRKGTPKWAPREKSWGLLAPSPDCFKDSGDLVVIPDRVIPRSYGWAQQAVELQMPQKSGTEATNWLGLPRKKFNLSLNCWRVDTNGKSLIVKIELEKAGAGYKRVQCDRLDDSKDGKPSSNSVLGIDQMMTRAVPVVQPDLDLSEVSYFEDLEDFNR